MRLHLPFTRRRSRPLPKPGRFENADKSGAFSKRIRFHLSCKRRNRIDLNTVTILARNFTWARRFKVVNLDRFTDFVLLGYFQTFNGSSTSSSVHVNCALCFAKQNGHVIIEPRSPSSIIVPGNEIGIT